MIDYEIDLFDEVMRAVLEVAPGAYVSSQHVAVPPQFPAVSVVETSNLEDAATRDSSGEEKYSSLVCTVNVYSASRDDPKAECKGIAQAIDGRMRARNFIRSYYGPVDNAADPSIYRIVARYTGEVRSDGTYFGR
ncbi:MAG: hypothetical protein U0M51_04160 [Eggerthellaceae bacterium]